MSYYYWESKVMWHFHVATHALVNLQSKFYGHIFLLRERSVCALPYNIKESYSNTDLKLLTLRNKNYSLICIVHMAMIKILSVPYVVKLKL